MNVCSCGGWQLVGLCVRAVTLVVLGAAAVLYVVTKGVR